MMLTTSGLTWERLGRIHGEKSGEGDQHFNPFFVFELQSRGELEPIFLIIHKEAKNADICTISRINDLATFSTVGPTNDPSRCQLDLKQGGNPVSMETEASGSTETRKREFEKIKDIFVPKLVTFKQKFNGESRFRVRQKVNEPLPYDIFFSEESGRPHRRTRSRPAWR